MFFSLNSPLILDSLDKKFLRVAKISTRSLSLIRNDPDEIKTASPKKVCNLKEDFCIFMGDLACWFKAPPRNFASDRPEAAVAGMLMELQEFWSFSVWAEKIVFLSIFEQKQDSEWVKHLR